MNRLNDLKTLYKTNRKLFDIVLLLVNITLLVFQALFALVSPSRINVFLLLILIGSLVYQLIKNP